MDKAALKVKALARYKEIIHKALNCGLPKLPKEMKDEAILRHKVCVRLGATQTEIEQVFCDEWNENEEQKECETQLLR